MGVEQNGPSRTDGVASDESRYPGGDAHACAGDIGTAARPPSQHETADDLRVPTGRGRIDESIIVGWMRVLSGYDQSARGRWVVNAVGAPTFDTRAWAAWLRRFARTTPGVVGILAVVIAASCIIAGFVAAAQLDRQIAARDAVLDHSEPVAYAAQNLYAALSAADAAAASAFLSGGTQTAQARERYQQALADAAAALADTTAGAADTDRRTAVAEVSALLAAYAGLVEAARANNLQGFPIGSAYLREASTLMQTKLLPGAERIYAADFATVSDDQRAVGSTPLLSLVLLALVLVVIGVGSAIMVARTNRQFNVGLLIAGVLVLLAILWIVLATRLAAADVGRSIEGSERFDRLTKARILAQQARTDETLQLIARGDITAGEQAFTDRIDGLVAVLGAGSPGVSEAVERWTAGHRKQVEAYLAGSYPAAVAQAIGPDPDASAAQFAAVEAGLRDELEDTRAALRDRVWAAGNFLVWSPAGTLVLMIAAAAAAVAGLWPRLKEFL